MLHSSCSWLVAFCLLSNSRPDTDLVRSWRLFLMFYHDPYNLEEFWGLIASCQEVLLGDVLQIASGPILLLLTCISSMGVLGFCLALLSLLAFVGQPVPWPSQCSTAVLWICFMLFTSGCKLEPQFPELCMQLASQPAPLHIGMPCSILSCCLEPLGRFTDIAKAQQKGHNFSGACVGVPGQWEEVIAQLLSCVCLCPACCAITLLPGI